MKVTSHQMKKTSMLLVSISIATTMILGTMLLSNSVFAASKAPQTFPTPVTKSLSAKWWQWAYSFNSDESPLSDATGERCDKGDKGKVFYLAGTAGLSSGSAERSCTISSKQAILFPVANGACLIEHPCLSPKVTDINQLKQEVSHFVDLVKFKEASLDGQNIDLSHARSQSPLFKTKVAVDNPFGEPPDAKARTAFADGYWILLKPLSVGAHVIHFKATFDLSELGQPDFTTEVTYHLTIE
jgi:hypothetical protein